MAGIRKSMKLRVPFLERSTGEGLIGLDCSLFLYGHESDDFVGNGFQQLPVICLSSNLCRCGQVGLVLSNMTSGSLFLLPNFTL